MLIRKGFTLIELVIVIVILGIIGAGTFQFLGNAVNVYSDTIQRESMLSESRFVLERLSRELRRAIPNSIRVNNGNNVAGQPFQCIEFAPYLMNSTYRSFPLAPLPAANEIEVIGLATANGIAPQNAPNCASDNCFFSSNQLNPGDFYNNNNLHLISSITTAPTDEDDDALDFDGDIWTIQLDQATSFSTESPGKRFYIASRAISYCLVNRSIFRFDSALSPLLPSLNGSQPNTRLLQGGQLMAQNLSNFSNGNNQLPFEFIDPTLRRNALVNLHLLFQRNNGETFNFNKEVHIPNVN